MKSMVIHPVVDSAVIRRGTIQRPACLMLGVVVRRTSVPGSTPMPGDEVNGGWPGRSATSAASWP